MKARPVFIALAAAFLLAGLVLPSILRILAGTDDMSVGELRSATFYEGASGVTLRSDCLRNLSAKLRSMPVTDKIGWRGEQRVNLASLTIETEQNAVFLVGFWTRESLHGDIVAEITRHGTFGYWGYSDRDNNGVLQWIRNCLNTTRP